MEASKNTFAGPQNQDTKLHFLDYWRIIRIRKTVILAVFLLVLLTTTAVTFILPETYMSTARIEVGKDNPNIGSILQPNAPLAYDPYFIQTEFEKIKSTKVLHRVIESLNLQTKWAQRFGTDTLKIGEAYKILVGQLELRQSRNTSLIEIRAYSDVKEEARDIANKIAETYEFVRRGYRDELSLISKRILGAHTLTRMPRGFTALAATLNSVFVISSLRRTLVSSRRVKVFHRTSIPKARASMAL